MYTVSEKKLREVLYEAELCESEEEGTSDDRVSIRADYSGRGMYGEECLGVTYDSEGDFLRFIVALARSTPEDAWYDSGDVSEWIPRARQDSMGRGAITYWPCVTVERDLEEEE